MSDEHDKTQVMMNGAATAAIERAIGKWGKRILTTLIVGATLAALGLWRDSAVREYRLGAMEKQMDKLTAKVDSILESRSNP